MAERGRGCGRRGRQGLRPRQERRGDADWVADKKKRAEKIRAAKAELEAEAKAAAAAKAKAQAEAEERRHAEGRKKPGKPAAPPSEEPDPKAQKNFTDPESRIMKTKDGFIQGYNAQAAVDATAQVIVAYGLDANQTDQHQLTPMVEAIEAGLGRKPAQLSADAGYCSDANLIALEASGVDAYVAPGGRSIRPRERAAARALPRCGRRLRPAATKAPIACASNCPSRCSDRSSSGASVSSCCVASKRSPPSGASSASPTTS